MLQDMAEKFYNMFAGFVPRLPSVIMALLIGYLLIRLFTFLFRRVLRLLKMNKATSEFIVSLINVLLWILLISEVAGELGLNRLALTISGSIVALGFALANGAASLTADIIAGLFLTRDRDFEVGYKIKVGDIEGTIEKIDIRKIRIKSGDGRIHVLPSSKVDTTGWTIIEK